MAKKKNNKKQNYANGKYYGGSKFVDTPEWIEASFSHCNVSPIKSDDFRQQQMLRLVGDKYVQKFLKTKNLPFEDFTNEWFGSESVLANQFFRDSARRAMHDVPGFKPLTDNVDREDLKAHNRRLIESLWLIHNRKHIVANESAILKVSPTEWDLEALEVLGDAAIEFVDENGDYLATAVEVTSYIKPLEPDGEEPGKLFSISLQNNKGLRMEHIFSTSRPNCILIPWCYVLQTNQEKLFSSFEVMRVGGVKAYLVLPITTEHLNEGLIKLMYVAIECAKQYCTVITKVATHNKAISERTNNSIPNKPTSKVLYKSLIKHIYLDDQAYTPSEYRKAYVKRNRPRCHERQGTWCTSKNGKVYWRKGSIVNPDLKCETIYTMSTPKEA